MHRPASRGFTLIEMSVVIAIIALISGGGLIMIGAALQGQRVQDTSERLDKLQLALKDYSNAFGRLPCPASLTAAPDAAEFGVGSGTGDVVGGVCADPAANCSAATFTSGDIAAGAVPTKTLGLPDTDALDGFGMRFTYAVDTRMTVALALRRCEQTNTDIGNITVNGDTGGVRTSKAVYVLLSHGVNGHGAYTAGGGALRRNMSVTTSNELENCDCTSAAASGTFDGVFVQRTVSGDTESATTFDDMLRYAVRSDLRAITN